MIPSRAAPIRTRCPATPGPRGAGRAGGRRLFFAGEATSPEFFSTAHGAGIRGAGGGEVLGTCEVTLAVIASERSNPFRYADGLLRASLAMTAETSSTHHPRPHIRIGHKAFVILPKMR
jgi:hypothetical protein